MEVETHSSRDGKGMGDLEDKKSSPPGLAHKPVFVCLFVCLGLFQYKNRSHQNSLSPMIMLIIPHSGWGFHPDENWKIPAKAQLFSNSQGIRVIDGSVSLFTQMFWCLGDKASFAQL